MTQPDFRALCVELLAAFEFHLDELSFNNRLCNRARAALNATPPPELPTDEEIDEFVVFWWGADTDERTVTDVIEGGNMTAFARAAFERWGK